LQKIKRGAVSLAYKDIGMGDATPMLFVHGWGCNHAFFAQQQAIIGKTRRTVAVDLRGHGSSDAPSDEYTVASFADDLLWMCRELKLAKPFLVGHSMGGTIALELAARNPNLFSAVILIDSVLFPSPDVLDSLRPLEAILRGPSYRSALEPIGSVLFLASDDAGLKSQILGSMAATPQHVLASAFSGHLINYDAASAASACRIPAAYIGAETSLADQARFQQLCPQLKIGRTLGSGHFSPLIVPDQIIAMLLGFEKAYGGGL
jgi:pimeloyl-ACP methyl ester carboxylesterase